MTGIAKTARERVMELPVSVESVALAPEIPALLIARVFESGVKWTRRISLVYGFCPQGGCAGGSVRHSSTKHVAQPGRNDFKYGDPA
jgi:hypothetical protein